jgi:heme A synthase
MIHGIALGGGALIALFAALFSLRATRGDAATAPPRDQSKYLSALTVAAATMLWLTVLLGTYVTFPEYRATPPADLVDLSRYPRSLIQSSSDTRWLHSFGMEIKEHMPWIAAMLATALAFITVRYRSRLLTERSLNTMASILAGVSLVLVGFVSLLGVFINKVAPLE